MSDNLEICYINNTTTSCNGGNNELGHPLIYLKIENPNNEIVCPYCSRKFILRNSK
jgi:uncharacterized Zn-finger protein